MANDGLITSFLGQGTAASRPASPTIAADAIAFWWSTDTDEMSAWVEGAWEEDILAGGGGGITELTGAVTAGPGSGSQAATIASNAVTTAKINDAAVTYAKIQDASATKRLLGRNTAGSGDFEEVTVEQLFAWIAGTPAQGDVFYRDGSGVARLAAGTAGQKLQTGGSGANPSWVGFSGALVKKSVDQTGANYTGGVAIAWDAEEYDLNSFHDNVTNNTRLTVPSGVNYVRVWASVTTASLTTSLDVTLRITKNGAAFIGRGSMTSDSDGTTPTSTVVSAVVAVMAGDYFEAFLTITTDTTVDIIAAGSGFGIEVCG